jgi:hypothetical protein
MLAGDRRFNDLEGIAIRAPNRDPARPQFIRQAGQSGSGGNEFGHTKRIFSGCGFIVKKVSAREKVGLNQSFVNQFLMMNPPGTHFDTHTEWK